MLKSYCAVGSNWMNDVYHCKLIFSTFEKYLFVQNLYEEINFLFVAVYWFVMGSSSITHEKGFSIILLEKG